MEDPKPTLKHDDVVLDILVIIVYLFMQNCRASVLGEVLVLACSTLVPPWERVHLLTLSDVKDDPCYQKTKDI